MKNPLIEQDLLTVRDPQTSPKDFRTSLHRIGFMMGYEMASTLSVRSVQVKTSLGEVANHKILCNNPVIINLLRAGTPFYQGLLDAYQQADSGFIGTMRDESTLESTISYSALPDLAGRIVLLADTMVATGGSMIGAYNHLIAYNPKRILPMCVLATQYAVEQVRKKTGVELQAACIDPILNDLGFIVPGLGDAGDCCYGRKQNM